MAMSVSECVLLYNYVQHYEPQPTFSLSFNVLKNYQTLMLYTQMVMQMSDAEVY